MKTNNANPHNLASNEIMLGKKTLFCIPANSPIQLEDIRQALLKEFDHEKVNAALKTYPDIMPYVFSMVNFFKRHNEVVVIGRLFDEDRMRNLINLFEQAFNCKLPYGPNGEVVKDGMGRDRIKFIVVKKLV